MSAPLRLRASVLTAVAVLAAVALATFGILLADGGRAVRDDIAVLVAQAAWPAGSTAGRTPARESSTRGQ